MPILVHLADEKNSKRIQEGGIKKGKISKGVYFMPLLKNYFVSYQWVRELRRSGIRNYVAVHFKLDSNEKVWAGKYFEPHKNITLGEAIKEINELEDPLGYELFIERKIYKKEILKILNIPQKTGWRYKPHSHREPLNCGCPRCIPKGSIKDRKLRERLNGVEEKRKSFDQNIRDIKGTTDPHEISDSLLDLRSKKWKIDPKDLEYLVDSESQIIQEDLAITLSCFKYKFAKQILIRLIRTTEYESVKEYATESLLELDFEKGLADLEEFYNDKIIEHVIEDQKNNNCD